MVRSPLLASTRPLYHNLCEGIRERVHIRFGAEWPWTRPNGTVRKCSNGPVNIGRAVQARPDGDLKSLVENAADFRRRQRGGAKAERTDPPALILMAEHLVAADFFQLPREPLAQCDLVGVDLLKPPLLDVLDARRQPN